MKSSDAWGIGFGFFILTLLILGLLVGLLSHDHCPKTGITHINYIHVPCSEIEP